MRKITMLFTLSVLALFTGSLMAQNPVYLGVKGGANLSKIDGVAYKDNFQLGYQLGGFLGVRLFENVGIQGEVLFNQTNTKLSDSYADTWDSAFDKGKTLNYVSVPVLLKLNPDGMVSFDVGPQFSFLTNRNENLWQNGEKLFKNSDFSFVAGAGLNLKPLVIYARYVWGFADISDFGDKANSQQIQLGVGLRFF